ncbi:TetR/AcrR family transcriptional regulator [Elongatibacter sediminis]|uniref:TetR/AcrR family transcriptional regulator n=1 Tax=Elongatibacter sediminis TaxID=3119006 RepID=A0AAW9RHJ7_9GAMM
MSSRPHLPAQERRELTVRAVIDLCGQQDPANLTTAAIAKHMNLTQGALFRHFPSKDAIWEAVAHWVSERLMARLDSAVDPTGGPLDALERMFMTHIEFITRHPGVPRLMLGQLQHEEVTPAQRVVDAMFKRYRDRLMAILADSDESGELADGLDREAAATAFIGAVQGLVIQSMVVGDVGLVRVMAPRVFALYRRGIAASGTQAG